MYLGVWVQVLPVPLCCATLDKSGPPLWIWVSLSLPCSLFHSRGGCLLLLWILLGAECQVVGREGASWLLKAGGARELSHLERATWFPYIRCAKPVAGSGFPSGIPCPGGRYWPLFELQVGRNLSWDHVPYMSGFGRRRRWNGEGTLGERLPNFQPPQWITEHLDKSLVGVERLGENQELQARFFFSRSQLFKILYR